MNLHDTITAVATAHGAAGISVIRVSGRDAFAVCENIFKPKHCTFDSVEANYYVYGDIYAGSRIIDDGMAVKFCSPKSYTGEDTVEISCHGSAYITNALLSAIISNGARIAEAGEFTRRAYLNGKITLTGAEALGRLITAKNKTSSILALAQSKGGLSKKVDSITEKINALLSEVYVTADFPDENLSDVTPIQMLDRISEILFELCELEDTYKTGKIIAEGIKTSIIGKPNTGKSTILNLLSKDDVAIVHDTPGTTRDIVTAIVNVGDFTLNLFDTAGIRTTENDIETIGINKTYKKIEESELIVGVFDISRNVEIEDHIIKKILFESKSKCKKTILVYNKYDESNEHCMEKYNSILSELSIEPVIISAKGNTTDKVDVTAYNALRSVFAALISVSDRQIDSGEILTEERQHMQIVEARRCLSLAKEALLAGKTQDAAGLDLEAAVQALSMVDSKNISDDMVDRIFRNFCVGK